MGHWLGQRGNRVTGSLDIGVTFSAVLSAALFASQAKTRANSNNGRQSLQQTAYVPIHGNGQPNFGRPYICHFAHSSALVSTVRQGSLKESKTTKHYNILMHALHWRLKSHGY